MKKYFLIIILIFITLGAIYLLFYDRINNQIPIIDGMYFNMSPKQAEKVLGKPIEREHDIKVSGKYIYTYETTVFDKDATIICFFIDDRKLTEVYIDWEGDIEGLRTQVRNRLYNHYHTHRDFFERSPTSDTSVEKQISMGIDNGCIGTFYSVYETPTRLSISCIFLR